jgi:3-oxoacyl-[acyl-carrier protein] reductase
MTTSCCKVSLITGASRGIGFSVAQLLLEQGYFVYGLSRNSSQELLELSQRYPCSLHHSCVDISDYEALKSLLRQIWSNHKQLNLVVHCAGLAYGGLLSLTPPEQFLRVFSTNYFAPIFLSSFASRFLSKSSSPQIIFISSSTAFRSDPGTLAYASSKAAVNFATKQLSFEYSSLGIRVNCIAPGVTNTSMLEQMSSSAIKRQLDDSAKPNICEPIQIESLVHYLCQPEADHINGQILRVDGGLP